MEPASPEEEQAVRILWDRRNGDPGMPVPPAIRAQYLAEVRQRKAEIEKEALALMEKVRPAQKEIKRRQSNGFSFVIVVALILAAVVWVLSRKP